MTARNGETELIRALWSREMVDDPYRAVLFAFPWGKAGTPLERFDGPREWQKDYMREVSEHLRRWGAGASRDIFRKAVASGRGPGKSALIGMLAWWFMSTRIGGSVVVTANTEPQLHTKTMPEIAKWFRMAVNEHWFDINAMSIKPALWFADLMKRHPAQGGLLRDSQYYYVSAQLWKEEVPDAFAGAHNWNGEMYIFDEASSIPESIWTVTEGVFTEDIPDRYFLVFSNPRKNSGPFFECFNRQANMWRPLQINCMKVPGINPDVYSGIIDKYGADSNQARVEVYGEFPLDDGQQFMSREDVDAARVRMVEPDNGAPLVMGVDVAREGGDECVIGFRQGRDARSIPWRRWREIDTVKFVKEVARAIDQYKPDGVFIDGGNTGGAVVDMLRAMKYRVTEVQFGAKAENPQRYKNRRVEMWDRMREWMKVGAIADDGDLARQLLSVEYDDADLTDGKIGLLSKKVMAARGLASPDLGDALALTFYGAVARRDSVTFARRSRVARDLDYPVLGG